MLYAYALKNKLKNDTVYSGVIPLKNFDNQFLALDTRAFRKYVESTTPDINFKVEYESQIGETHTVEVPIGIRFFWPDSEL